MGPASVSNAMYVLIFIANQVYKSSQRKHKITRKAPFVNKEQSDKKMVPLVFLLLFQFYTNCNLKVSFFQKVLMFLPFPQTYKPFIFLSLEI